MSDVQLGTRYAKIVRIFAIALVAMQAILFPIIQLTPWSVSSYACYASIILVVAFSLVSGVGERSGHLIRLGLLFTLVADYFLVIEYDSDLEGVIAFLAVQLCYFAYTFAKEDTPAVRNLNAMIRVLIVIVMLAACFLILGDEADPLSIVSAVYYGNLVVNVIFAFALGKEERLFAIGLLLFAMCDLCIGLDMIFNSYIDNASLDIFYGEYYNLPWVFYQPSQILITLHLGQKYTLQKTVG